MGNTSTFRYDENGNFDETPTATGNLDTYGFDRADRNVEKRVVASLQELSAFVQDRTGELTDAQHELLGMFATVLAVVESGVRSPEEAKVSVLT